MSNRSITIDQVVEVLRRLDNAHAWIGEGDDIVSDLLAWIDGADDGIAIWALGICLDCGVPSQVKHTRWCRAGHVLTAGEGGDSDDVTATP